MEWLPALLEQACMAMMTVNQDPHALDAYEMLFHLGMDGDDQLAQWIETGETIAGRSHPTQVTGGDPAERKASVLHALGALRAGYTKREEGTAPKLVSNFEAFRTVPYGYELTPVVLDCLSDLEAKISNRATEDDFG
jgi:hypothetical protein